MVCKAVLVDFVAGVVAIILLYAHIYFVTTLEKSRIAKTAKHHKKIFDLRLWRLMKIDRSIGLSCSDVVTRTPHGSTGKASEQPAGSSPSPLRATP